MKTAFAVVGFLIVFALLFVCAFALVTGQNNQRLVGEYIDLQDQRARDKDHIESLRYDYSQSEEGRRWVESFVREKYGLPNFAALSDRIKQSERRMDEIAAIVGYDRLHYMERTVAKSP